ncbi:hypothetical protein BSNK01_10000 [Bacillaceae bacterium]
MEDSTKLLYQIAEKQESLHKKIDSLLKEVRHLQQEQQLLLRRMEKIESQQHANSFINNPIL